MPRSKCVAAVGTAHHVTQRGNGRQDVFVNEGPRRAYLDLLAGHAGRNNLRVVAYCLMTNHAHLVVVPESEGSLADTFRHAYGHFSQDWNTAFHRTGHWWQNRFYFCPVEGAAERLVIRKG
jgi:putative transposase